MLYRAQHAARQRVRRSPDDIARAAIVDVRRETSNHPAANQAKNNKISSGSRLFRRYRSSVPQTQPAFGAVATSRGGDAVPACGFVGNFRRGEIIHIRHRKVFVPGRVATRRAAWASMAANSVATTALEAAVAFSATQWLPMPPNL